MLKDVYAAAAVNDDDDKSLKAVQKLLINTTAERDYTLHRRHATFSSMFRASRDFILCPCAAALRSRLRTYICKRSFDRWPP